MMRRYPALALSVVFLAAVAASLTAQQPTGSITGIVTDPSGAVIPGAGVTIISKATRATIALSTSEAGAYTAASLLPGAYELRAEARGFKTTVVELIVEVGRVTPADIHMEVGAVAQQITVQAQAVAVNPTQTALEGIVTDNLIRNLPLNGRNFLDLGQLEPGVQLLDLSTLTPTKGAYTALSVGGQTGESARITVDGLDISDEIAGTNAQNVSQDSIQEYQISRSALDVSTGLTGSGAVNIVTKSGGNEVHGSGFLFWRSDRFAARIGQQPMPFDREQVGFTSGGPFIRDKLFWFVSYERNNQDGAVATQVAGFPQLTGVWQAPFDERMAMGRLDWNITQSTRSFFRFTHNYNNGVATGRLGLGGTQLTAFTSKDNANQTALGLDTATGRLTHSLRYGFFNYANYVDDAANQVPGLPRIASPEGRPVDISFFPFGFFDPVNRPPVFGPTMMTPFRLLQHNHELRYDGTLSFGRHTVRWGSLVNVIRMNWLASFFGNAPEMDISFNAANQAICADDILCYPVTSAIIANGLGYLTEVPTLGLPFGGGKNTRFHWYLSDSWRAASRLNINYGVRYIYEPGQSQPDLVKPPLLDEFMPGLSARERRDKNNFAPHLGLAWDPTGSGKWVMRAGGGLFYDVNYFNTTAFTRHESLPPGISWEFAFPPFVPVINPLTGGLIFDMVGADPTAQVTPGVNWISGCSDPRFPGGECSLGTPGLMDAVLAAWDAFRAASQAASANFPSGPPLVALTRSLTDSFLPDYQTPYSLQFNFGVQRELRPGLILSVDYLQHRGLHYPLKRDLNRVAAADTLSVANALAAMDALHAALDCPGGAAGVDCAIAHGATIENYAGYGLGRGEAASGAGPSIFAFPGLNPNFNRMQLAGMQGRSTYDALQVALRGRLPDLGNFVKDWTVAASYSLSRMKGTADDREFGSFETPINNDNLFAFFGPTTLDRTHMLSLGSMFRIPGGVRLNSIWRAFTALPQSVFVPQVSGSPAEIFYTDFNGDGTVGDPLPGTSRGSFGRDAGSVEELNRLVSSFNGNVVGSFTPAAQALIDAGLFTPSQLTALGAVANRGNPLPLAPTDQVMLDSFLTTDLRISRPFKIWRERITVEPAFEWFNLFNVANYDLPGNRLLPWLSGAPGSINGTTRAYRPNRAGFGPGSFALGIPRSWQFALRVSF